MSRLNTSNTVIAIDIGGTQIRVARVNTQGEIVATRRFSTPHGHPDQALPAALSKIERCVAELTAGDRCHGIGIAAPGPTNSAEGLLMLAPSLGWRDVPLRAHFEQCFGLPVRVSNDVQAAALGELRFGWGQKPLATGQLPQNLFWMTISTGIGGCVVANGTVYRGNGTAGEIGHFILEENGPVGACGHSGCLESLASGPTIAALAKQRIAQGEASQILTFAGDLDHISPPVIAQAARQGDPLARRLWQDAGSAIGKALSYVINLLDPDLLVLGGGVILGASDLILDPITAFAHNPRHYLPNTRPTLPPIVQTWHGANAGLVGAAALGIMAYSETFPTSCTR